MAPVTLFENFSADQVSFSELKKNKLGGKYIPIDSSDGGKILLQMPAMRAPFGLSAFTDAGSGKVSYSLDLSLDDAEVRAKLQEVDERVVKYVADNSQTFLGKPYKLEVIKEALFKPLVKPGKGDYAPTLKLKVVTGRDGNFIPECYDSTRKSCPLDSIEKGGMVHTIVEVSQIWFIDNKFGVSVRLQQALKLPSNNLKGFAFAVESEVDIPEDVSEASV